MNFTFTTTHIETLVELTALAEKHNCYINFGTASDSGSEILDEVLLSKGFTQNMVKEVQDKLVVSFPNYAVNGIWFSLCDKSKDTENVLKYIVTQTDFHYDVEDSLAYGISEETLKKLSEVDCLSNGYICLATAYTKVSGFGLETQKSNLVYRSGIALKYFAEYVCDYLGEPRLNKVY